MVSQPPPPPQHTLEPNPLLGAVKPLEGKVGAYSCEKSHLCSVSTFTSCLNQMEPEMYDNAKLLGRTIAFISLKGWNFYKIWLFGSVWPTCAWGLHICLCNRQHAVTTAATGCLQVRAVLLTVDKSPGREQYKSYCPRKSAALWHCIVWIIDLHHQLDSDILVSATFRKQEGLRKCFSCLPTFNSRCSGIHLLFMEMRKKFS